MVSPFMAFAKGAFEGYNDIQEEKRAHDANMALETHKANITAQGSSNMFTAQGTRGVQPFFAFSENPTENERSKDNLRLAAQTFSPEYMTALKENDPTLYRNINIGVADLMTTYKDEHTKENVKTGDQIIPFANQVVAMNENPYFQKMWRGIINQSQIDVSNYNPNIVIEENIESNGDKSYRSILVDEQTHGFSMENFAQWAVTIDKERGGSFYAGKQVDPAKIVGDYTKKYRAVVPFYYSPATDANGQVLRNIENKPVMMSEIFELIAAGGVVDESMITAFESSVNNWNNNPQVKLGEKTEINNSTVFAGLSLAAKKKHIIQLGTGDRGKVISDGATYMTDVLKLDLQDISAKVGGSRTVLRTLENMERVMGDSLIKENSALPLSRFAGDVTQFFAAFLGKEGTIPKQLSNIGDMVFKKTGVTTSKSAQDMLTSSWEDYQDQTTIDGQIAAKFNFYKNMLAYQLAVAIQGGTGGRTVSDQDVDNMKNAFGDRLFQNNMIQISVLKEVKSFVQEIITSNGDYLDAAGQSDGIDHAIAAYGFLKLYNEGLDFRQAQNAGPELTRILGDKLRRRIEGNSNTAGYIQLPSAGYSASGEATFDGEAPLQFEITIGKGKWATIKSSDPYDLLSDLRGSMLAGEMEPEEALLGLFDSEGKIMNNDAADRYYSAWTQRQGVRDLIDRKRNVRGQ